MASIPQSNIKSQFVETSVSRNDFSPMLPMKGKGKCSCAKPPNLCLSEGSRSLWAPTPRRSEPVKVRSLSAPQPLAAWLQITRITCQLKQITLSLTLQIKFTLVGYRPWEMIDSNRKSRAKTYVCHYRAWSQSIRTISKTRWKKASSNRDFLQNLGETPQQVFWTHWRSDF